MAQYKIIVRWCKIENAYPGVSAAACLKNACFSHIARFLCCIIQSDSSFPEVYNKGHVHSDTAISSNFFFWKRWRIISKRKIRSSVKLRHCYWSDLRNHFASSSCCRRRSSFDSLLLGLIPSTIAVRIAPCFSIIQIEAWYLVSSKTAEEPE